MEGRDAGRGDSAVDIAIAVPAALRSGSDAGAPDDERLWRYQDVTCGRCGAVVQVVKFSPQHTSVQWTADAALTCAEFAAAGHSPDRTTVPVSTCVSLRASISAAVVEGRIEIKPP